MTEDDDDGTDLSQVGASRSYSDIHEVSYALAVTVPLGAIQVDRASMYFLTLDRTPVTER